MEEEVMSYAFPWIEDGNKFYNIVEDDTKLEFQIPVPGIKDEDCKASVKKNVLEISFKNCTFVKYSKLYFEIDFKLKEDNLTVFVEDGVLYIIAEKPVSDDFEVEIGK